MELERWDKVAVAAVCLVASIHLMGFVSGSRTLKGLGVVTTASPLPLVFTAHKGLETFAQSYSVTLIDESGDELRVNVDAQRYGKLSGSYNQRNAYGAIFSHGPVLAKAGEDDILDSVFHFGICTDRALLSELEIDIEPVEAVAESRPADPGQNPWTYRVSCP